MIEIIKKNNSLLYKDFLEYYYDAIHAGQKNIEAVCISSFNHITEEVQSRYVNLKYINNNEWIFFSNYESPKSIDFESHPQISALFYWQNIDVQIRMKASISKTDSNFSDLHFKNRDRKKAFAISRFKKNWVIETHSETLLFRLLKEIRNGNLNKNDLNVLYIDHNNEKGSSIKKMMISDDGELLSQWPDGFFSTDVDEIFD